MAGEPWTEFQTKSSDDSGPWSDFAASKPKATPEQETPGAGNIETGARALAGSALRIAGLPAFAAGGLAGAVGANDTADRFFNAYERSREAAKNIEGPAPTSIGGRVAQAIGALPGGIASLGANSMIEPAANVIKEGGTIGEANTQLGLNTAANVAGLGIGSLGKTVAQRVLQQGAASGALGEASRVIGNATRGPDQQQEFDPVELGINIGAGAGLGGLMRPHEETATPKPTLDEQAAAIKAGVDQRLATPALAPPAERPDFVVNSRGQAVPPEQAAAAAQGGPGFEQQTAPPPVQPNPEAPAQPLALGHEPDVIVDARGRAVVNKGDRTLGQPFRGPGFDEQAPVPVQPPPSGPLGRAAASIPQQPTAMELALQDARAKQAPETAVAPTQEATRPDLRQAYADRQGQIDALNAKRKSEGLSEQENNTLHDLNETQQNTNALTGLPNKAAFQRAEKDPQYTHTVAIDARGFKSINDTHGHNAGDDVLRVIGQHLAEHFANDPDVSIFHTSGDEFPALTKGDQTAKIQAATEALEKQPFKLNVKQKDGSVDTVEFPGVKLDFGVGKNLEEADANAVATKEAAAARGEYTRRTSDQVQRAVRPEETQAPAGPDRVSDVGRQDNANTAAEPVNAAEPVTYGTGERAQAAVEHPEPVSDAGSHAQGVVGKAGETQVGQQPQGGHAQDSRAARLAEAEQHNFTKSIPEEIGWEQVGGKLLRAPLKEGEGALGKVIGLTQWVGKQGPLGESGLWRSRPDKALKESQAREALQKAQAGEPLRPIEQRFVDHAKRTAKLYAEQEEKAREEHAKERGFASVDEMHAHDAANMVGEDIDHAFNNTAPQDHGSEVPFSRAGGKPGMSRAALAGAIHETISGWHGDAPQVEVLQSHTDPKIPQEIRNARGFGGDVEGAYHNGVAYLFADAIRSPKRGLEVLAHEGIGHFAMERQFGDQWPKIVRDINAMREKAPAYMRKIFAEVDRRYPGADAETHASETLAVMAEKGIHNAIMDRAFAAMRRFLRSLGFDLKFSDAELRQMLVAAKRRVEGERRAAAAQGALRPAFAKRDTATVDMFGGSQQAEAETPKTYSVFRGISKSGPNDHGVAGKGEYWSGRRQAAEAYAKGSGNVVESEVTLKKPLVATYSELAEIQKHAVGKVLSGFDKDLSEKFDRWMRDNGYDGAALFDPEVSKTVPEEVVKLAPETKMSPQSGDLFGGATSRDHTDAAVRAKEEQLRGSGAAPTMRQGAGELFAGKRPEQTKFSKGETEDNSGMRAHAIPEEASVPLSRYRNDAPLKRDVDYTAAKSGDRDAAIRLVQRQAQPLVEQAQAKFGKDVVYVAPHAVEASGENAIPQTMAAYLAHMTGAKDDTSIVQVNRVYHTGANAMERLIARSTFDGEVQKGAKYVLADDVTTMGGTMADLAHYIQSKGGEVVGSVNLVNASRSGKIGPDRNTARQIEGRYGDEIRKQFGIEPSALTTDEARYLIGFRNADELRNRAASAAQERDQRLRSKGVQSEGSVSESGAPPSEGRNVSGEPKFSRANGHANGEDEPTIGYPGDIHVARERLAQRKFDQPYASLPAGDKAEINAMFQTTSAAKNPMFSKSAEREKAVDAIKQVAKDNRENVRNDARAALAQSKRNTGAAMEAIRAMRDEFDKRINAFKGDYKKLYAGISALERGEKTDDPLANALWQSSHALLGEQLQRLNSLGADIHERVNYFSHIWKDQGRAVAEDTKKAESVPIGARRPLAGNKYYTKERVFETIMDGLNAGREPISANPVDMFMARYAQGEKLAAALHIRQAIEGRGLVQPIEGDRVPHGYARVNDGVFAGKALPELIARDLNNHLDPGLGKYKAWRDFRYAQNLLLSTRLGLSAFHAGMTTLDSIATHVDVGVRRALSGDLKGAMHDLFQATRAPLTAVQELAGKGAGSKLVRQWYGKEAMDANTRALLDMAMEGGARARMDATDYNHSLTSFRRAWVQGDIRTQVKNAIPAAIELTTHHIAQNLVPAQKMTARVLLLKFEMDRLADKLGKAKGDYAGIKDALGVDEIRQISRQVNADVDDRLGQFSYDNEFWNRVLKDAAHAGIQSVGWNFGSFRLIAGGLKDLGNIAKPETYRGEGPLAGQKMSRLTNRLSYLITLNAVVAAMGAMTQYALTGQPPQEPKDFFFPKTGRKNPDDSDERLAFPSYVKDEYALSHHPIQTIQHKLHPSLSMAAEMFQNRDFYGNEIVDPEAPWPTEAKEFMQYLGKSFLPYSLQGAAKNAKSGDTAAMTALPFIGITPAPGDVTKSPFQSYVSERYFESKAGTKKTPEQAAQSQVLADAIAAKKAGRPVDMSKLLPWQKAFINKPLAPLPEHIFEKMLGRDGGITIKQALHAYEVATPEERERYKLAQTIRKNANAKIRQLPREEQQAVRAQVYALGK